MLTRRQLLAMAGVLPIAAAVTCGAGSGSTLELHIRSVIIGPQ